MKIGILTYHRAENYGALLQAYALRSYLQSLGHDVSFVDYWPQYHKDYFKIFSLKGFRRTGVRGKMDYILNSTIWLCPKIIRKRRLLKFVTNELGAAQKPRYNEKTQATEHYDIVVYGSDQIWRKQNLSGVGFDDWYFGASNIVADRKVVYAGSMGTVKTTKEDDEYIMWMMKNFNGISVREADLQQYLHSLEIPTSLVIDPVFLLSKEQWAKVAEPKSDNSGKYILFYNLLNKPESVHFAEKLSKETGLPIKELNKKMSFSHLGRRYISTASVNRFLRLVQDAEYVVSNSFHGVAMSLVFQKQFFAVGMGEKANRVKSLLNSAGIEGFYVEDAHLSPLRLNHIDYNKVAEKLEAIIGDSKLFLNQSIK